MLAQLKLCSQFCLYALSNLCRRNIAKTLSHRIHNSIQFTAFVRLFKTHIVVNFCLQSASGDIHFTGSLSTFRLPSSVCLTARWKSATLALPNRSSKTFLGTKYYDFLLVHLAARFLWTMLRLPSRIIPQATSICQDSSLLQIWVSCAILTGCSFNLFR